MAKDLHILVLSSWYPTEDHPYLGNFVERQAGLLALEYKVTVVHTNHTESSGIVIQENNNHGFRELIVNFNKKGNSIRRKALERSALLHGLKQVEGVDLIIGNVLLPNGWLFVAAQKRFKCPLFYVEHGSYFRPERKEIWKGVNNWNLRRVRRIAKVIVAVSETLKFDMAPYFPKHEIKVLGNHVDTALFYPKSKVKNETTHFLHVSTLDENTKNPKGIIEAVRLLKKENFNFKLTIVCDEDVSKWENLVKEYELNDVIEFKGPLRWDELLPYYHNADAFVLFSDYESFSIVLAEAWTTGTPVLSTPVGIASNMQSYVGLTVQKNDPEDLKNKMVDIINNTKQFETEEIINLASNYSETTILDEWKKLINIHVK